MSGLVNRCKFTTATTGTGNITPGAASTGYYYTPAGAGVSDGVRYAYVIEDGAAGEEGTCTFSSSGTVMARSPTRSTNSNNAINLSGAAAVFITALAADLRSASHGKTRASAMNQFQR